MRLIHLASVTLMAASLAAVETSRNDLRLMVGMVPAYEVQEDSTPAAGGATSGYDWQGTDISALAIGVQYLVDVGKPRESGRPVIGAEVLIHSASLKPETYASGGSTLSNVDGEQFSYVAISPALVLGWRFAQPENNRLGLLGELQAVAGVTLLTGQIDNQYGTDTSFGYGVDGGVRALLGLQEAGWTGNVSVGVRRGWATISMDQDTKTSDLTLDAMGVEVLVSAGYLF